MAQSWRNSLCAVMKVRLGKSMALVAAPLLSQAQRTHGAWRAS
jgi:hypothetical protein